MLWWVSAENSQQAGAPTGREASGRFFGGRWFPREGRVSDEERQALRCASLHHISIAELLPSYCLYMVTDLWLNCEVSSGHTQARRSDILCLPMQGGGSVHV